MTPREYTQLYHELRFQNPITNVQVIVELTEYGSGWRDETTKDGKKIKCNRPEIGPKAQNEFTEGLSKALRVLHHGNPNTPCGKVFSFKSRAPRNIDPDENFFGAGLSRAFLGKGSPYEIIDALRLALITGRIGSGTDARGKPSSQLVLPAYLKNFFTLDCNGLVGNYHGMNPETEIKEYAKPERRRMRVGDIRIGDPLVTHGDAKPYEHLAMVSDITPTGANEAIVEICEWGDKGDFSQHCKKLNGGRPIPITIGFEGGLACDITGSEKETTRRARYFYAPPGGASSPRFYGMRGDETL